MKKEKKQSWIDYGSWETWKNEKERKAAELEKAKQEAEREVKAQEEARRNGQAAAEQREKSRHEKTDIPDT